MIFKGQFTLSNRYCITDGQIPNYQEETTLQPDENAIDVQHQIPGTFSCRALATKIIHHGTLFKFYDNDNKYYCKVTKTYLVYEESVVLINYLVNNSFNSTGDIFFHRDNNDVLRYYCRRA